MEIQTDGDREGGLPLLGTAGSGWQDAGFLYTPLSLPPRLAYLSVCLSVWALAGDLGGTGT